MSAFAGKKGAKPVGPLDFFGTDREIRAASAEEIGAKLNHLYIACQVAKENK